MSFSNKTYYVITLLLAITYLTAMYNLFQLIWNVEIGNTSMNAATREEMNQYLWLLLTVIIPFFIRKKECEKHTTTIKKEA